MSDYDAIIVGARCAGSSTAMLLARQGYRVLLVDRATFPSDTMSTHVVHNPGAAQLRSWGLADRLVATGCPAIDTYRFDFGPFAIAGTPRAALAVPVFVGLARVLAGRPCHRRRRSARRAQGPDGDRGLPRREARGDRTFWTKEAGAGPRG